jgi:hypothetical protein
VTAFELGVICGAAATIAVIGLGGLVFILADRVAEKNAGGAIEPSVGVQPDQPWPRR